MIRCGCVGCGPAHSMRKVFECHAWSLFRTECYTAGSPRAHRLRPPGIHPHDKTASARHLGIQHTGHAARGVGGAPSASPSNLYMVGGTRNRSELLAAFPEAVLIIELIGQGVNGVTGDY